MGCTVQNSHIRLTNAQVNGKARAAAIASVLLAGCVNVLFVIEPTEHPQRSKMTHRLQQPDRPLHGQNPGFLAETIAWFFTASHVLGARIIKGTFEQASSLVVSTVEDHFEIPLDSPALLRQI
jgi:ABC-type Fe3+ transport system permease subunit